MPLKHGRPISEYLGNMLKGNKNKGQWEEELGSPKAYFLTQMISRYTD